MPHSLVILYVAILGSCVGSFLNVVVWRLPRVEPIAGESIARGFWRSLEAISSPPSHCPRCNRRLKWYDNLPVIGWLKLGGRCRFCQAPISMRYPVVEAMTGLLFAGYYYAFYVAQIGPCRGVSAEGHVERARLLLGQTWWIYGLDMLLLSGLLAASLIDAELFIIPMEIPWVIAPIAVALHAAFDTPATPGNLLVGPLPAALALGALIGLVISHVLTWQGIFPRAFAEGTPMLDIERQAMKETETRPATMATAQPPHGPAGKKRAGPPGRKKKKRRSGSIPVAPAADGSLPPREWTSGEIRREIGKEMLFLLPPLFLAALLAALAWKVPPAARLWNQLASPIWARALLGSVLGGAAGGFIVWLTRILGSLGFGREAMGMGDVDLMVAVGAVLGAGPAVAAFFIAPFFGIAYALYMLLTGNRRELPYGPYLSLASAAVMLFYCPIAAYFAPGFANLAWMMRSLSS